MGVHRKLGNADAVLGGFLVRRITNWGGSCAGGLPYSLAEVPFSSALLVATPAPRCAGDEELGGMGVCLVWTFLTTAL